MRTASRSTVLILLTVLIVISAGCAELMQGSGGSERTTSRDKTAKGAGIGAAAGAVLGAVLGEGEADEILAGAAIGAGIGAGVGAYMDKQEEKLARIPGTTVERIDNNMLLVHFESDILFAVNSATLSGDARRSLDQAIAVFQEYPKTAIVAQGHTDSTGSDDHNQRLSEQRADSVRGYLIARGIDGQRIAALGYGESHPVADNSSEYGRRKNRRVDLLLKAKAK